MSPSLPTIGITLGDPAGIAPEVVIKALTLSELKKKARYVVIGDKNVFKHYKGKEDDHCLFLDLKTGLKDYTVGKESADCGRAAFLYLEHAVEMLRNKEIHGLVTAPLSKRAVMMSGQEGFFGHTEYLANAFEIKDFEMMFVGGPFKTIIATRHIPLSEVPGSITADKLYKTIALANQALKNTFGIESPRIAVCGMNPHAGEGGKIGTEEAQAVIPAIERAQTDEIDAQGPFAADTIFITENSIDFDLIIAMYHDQGLAPMKALYFKELVNLTIGLPFIRTSTAHGTAFGIAGQNKADASSMAEAIDLAASLTLKRQTRS